VSVARSILLFAVAALFEIGGAVCLAGLGVMMYAPRGR
jgi:drug/metabolite transporter superfamily protein YnfA